MISNSVTHLRSYTNSAIADIAGNYKDVSVKHQCLRIERQYRPIEW